MCKVSAYADDLVMFCRDKSDLDYVFSFFDKVAIATGSTLNKSKTKVLYLGPKWDSSVYGQDEIKICGIQFNASNDGKSTFQECETKITSRIEKFKHLTLTLRGKVLICNTMLFPVLFYACILNHFVQTSVSQFSLLFGVRASLNRLPAVLS